MKRDKIVKKLYQIYGIFVCYAVLIGVVTGVMYLAGFVIGGSAGSFLAIYGAKIMKTALPTAALGALCGVFAFYIEGKHELTMKKDKR